MTVDDLKADIELPIEVMKRINRKLSKKALGAFPVTIALTDCLFPEALNLYQLALKMQEISIPLRKLKASPKNRYWELLEEFELLAAKFNKICSRYRCYKSISLPHVAAGAPRPDLTAVGKDDSERMVCELAFSAIDTLLDLLATDQVHLVRRCEYCGDWFYADRLAQRFCYETCRKSFFESRADVRERRNEKRRQRYKESVEDEKAYNLRNGIAPFRRRK
jgi:hypothetical protein